MFLGKGNVTLKDKLLKMAQKGESISLPKWREQPQGHLSPPGL